MRKTSMPRCSLVLFGAVFSSLTVAVSAAAADKPIKYTAGIIDSDGTIIAGSGFNIAHEGTGIYTITYPAGSFGGGFPTFSCTPEVVKIRICDIYDYSRQGGLKIQFRIYERDNGVRQDARFHFLEITPK